VTSFAISTGVSTHILDKLPIPRFNEKNVSHVELARLAEQCGQAAAKSKKTETLMLESNIDRSVAKFWNVSDAQLEVIQSTLDQVGETEDEEEEPELPEA
jgi:hypothetical protein